jgi:trans-2,3-dihydro-3-hydroxyanthranilate isomerase
MPIAEFVTLDVFTSERFAGNPLAVVPDARALTADDMQKIAAEFGYSESTFVLPPEGPANSARVHIFTPTTEIPFAGHPNVGTAFLLGQQSQLFERPIGDKLRFEESGGLVEVELLRDNGMVAGATIRAPQPLQLGDEIDPQLVPACASLATSQIRIEGHPPVIASVGLPFAFAELESLEALAAARANISVFHEAAARHPRQNGDFSLFLYVRISHDPASIRARMFAPLDNVLEDPATGSASAALAALLVSRNPDTDGRFHLTIEQGVEMGRRSIIEVEVAKTGGRATDVRVTGRCVSVMRGTLQL